MGWTLAFLLSLCPPGSFIPAMTAPTTEGVCNGEPSGMFYVFLFITVGVAVSAALLGGYFSVVYWTRRISRWKERREQFRNEKQVR